MSKKIIVKLTPEQLEQKAQFINEYMKANNAADGSSVDSNANVSCKNVATLMAEMHKDINVQIKRYLVSQKIKELFGEDLAKEYNRQIENHLIYVHDESHIAFPYCVSISMYPFLLNGLKDLGGESKKPEHLVSYCGNFVNLVYAISSQFAGAVATVEFLMYFDYFARKDFGDDYLQTHAGYIANCFQQVVYSLNQPASARGFQSVFWNISIFDKPYFESLFGEFRFPDCSAPKYETLSKLQEFFMTWFNQERTKAILTFPVVTAAILTKDGVPVDEDFEDMCASQDTAGNSFFKYESSEVDSLASCCRLRNELQDNTFSYSLGAGGVSTGSLNVITLNANRFVQDCVSDLKILKQQFTQEEKNEYIKSRLNEEIKMLHKFQMATKAYLEEYLKNKMLPVYDAGYINMSKQFLTIGLNGLVEAAEFMGYEIGNNKEYKNFTSEFLKVIYFANQEGRQQYKTMFNTEFVPAENLGVKNYNWDKEDGYVVNPKRNCYNSYMYAVEDEETTPLDKFIIHGKDNLQYLDGGSSVHLNLEEYPTKEGYKKLYRAAAKTGCNYWTTNVKITCCEDCGYIDKHTLQKCPKCGSKNVSWATRIIGYLQKLSSFSSERQKEATMRYYHKGKSTI